MQEGHTPTKKKRDGGVGEMREVAKKGEGAMMVVEESGDECGQQRVWKAPSSCLIFRIAWLGLLVGSPLQVSSAQVLVGSS